MPHACRLHDDVQLELQGGPCFSKNLAFSDSDSSGVNIPLSPVNDMARDHRDP